ncbi:MAG TPA: VOC family protein [Pyrinomonadaceae bacterium]|nr:VOC family protein [Pyrinomonadaceae bacterium]
MNTDKHRFLAIVFSILSFSLNFMAQETSIGGIYEVGIGATDEKPLVAYFERFGYRVGSTGELSEKEAEKLYGVKSKLKSIRLLHQDADHGLIRIMVWEKPTNEGLQMSQMNVLGNRWGAMMTGDIYNLQNHAEEAIAQKLPVFMVEPQRAEIYKLEKRPIPFLENYATVREMCLIQPLTRQILFQRFGYNLANYGKINEQSFFKSSQITHFGMVVYRNQENLDFYDKVLGLLKVKEGKDFESTYENPSSRAVFSLEKHQKYGATDFDNPKSSTNPANALSGRLKIIWFSEDSKLENKFDYSKPGSLGYSLYTYRVKGIEKYREKVKSSKANGLTEIKKNEFGEKSFSFIAPDGYFWTILE